MVAMMIASLFANRANQFAHLQSQYVLPCKSHANHSACLLCKNLAYLHALKEGVADLDFCIHQGVAEGINVVFFRHGGSVFRFG